MHYRGNALPKRTPLFWREVIGICIVILLAIIIEAWGHDTPKIRAGTETHTLSRSWPDGGETLHWHEDADGQGAGAWDQCVADAYDPETDSYNLPGGQCAEESTPPPPPPLPQTEPPEQTQEQDTRNSFESQPKVPDTNEFREPEKHSRTEPEPEPPKTE